MFKISALTITYQKVGSFSDMYLERKIFSCGRISALLQMSQVGTMHASHRPNSRAVRLAASRAGLASDRSIQIRGAALEIYYLLLTRRKPMLLCVCNMPEASRQLQRLFFGSSVQSPPRFTWGSPVIPR